MRDSLEATWASLAKPAGQGCITGKRAPGLSPNRAAYLSLDGAGRRHLLVLVPDGTEPVTLRETRALQVATERFQVGGHPDALYIDMACLDHSQNPTFSAVAEDLLISLNGSTASARDAVLGALSRWKAFWSSRTAGLSREEALGLFGELWFLKRWMGHPSAAVLSRWMTTPRARHDFQWPEASVEIKTAATISPGGSVHRIANLDQLDNPVTGQLYLFSLQVVDDALATNTLAGMVETLVHDLRNDSQSLMSLNEKLASYGYNPADTTAYNRRLRVVAERLYVIVDGFPRLTRASFVTGLPSGIDDVTYSLAVSACDHWLVARSPADPGACFLKA